MKGERRAPGKTTDRAVTDLTASASGRLDRDRAEPEPKAQGRVDETNRPLSGSAELGVRLTLRFCATSIKVLNAPEHVA